MLSGQSILVIRPIPKLPHSKVGLMKASCSLCVYNGLIVFTAMDNTYYIRYSKYIYNNVLLIN